MNWALLKSVQVASYKSCKYCPSYDCLAATSDTMSHLEGMVCDCFNHINVNPGFINRGN